MTRGLQRVLRGVRRVDGRYFVDVSMTSMTRYGFKSVGLLIYTCVRPYTILANRAGRIVVMRRAV